MFYNIDTYMTDDAEILLACCTARTLMSMIFSHQLRVIVNKSLISFVDSYMYMLSSMHALFLSKTC